MFYDAIKNDHGLPIDPLYAIVGPRPIGWISTLDSDGVANLAPFSFFNLFAQSPHYVAFGSSGYKNTMANIEATREFVVNVATFALREAMNQSSAALPAHMDEFEFAGIAKAPSSTVRPPRVAASPAALECKYFQTVPLPDDTGSVGDWMVIGRVTGIHIDDQYIKDGRVDTKAMGLIGRLGYSEYATVSDVWRMRRPG